MKVLLLGDSVRLFYEKEVRKILGDGYEVFSAYENCRFSSFFLNSLRFWLSEIPAPDIIHFNIGLWDTAVLYPEDGCFTPLCEYVRNMKRVLRELKKSGAKIIFATSTPVSDQKENLPGPMPPAHRNEDIISYNKAVLEAFKDEDVVINDLFSVVYENRGKYLSDDMIHPNAEGVEILAEAVANAIKSVGEYENSLENPEENTVSREERLLQ